MMNDSALLKAICENVADGIVIVDAEGLILSINPAACALFGYTADELTVRNISLLMTQYDKLRLQAGRLRRATRQAGQSSQVNALKKDGTSFPARLSISEVNDGGGQRYAGVIHDLSQEKKSEEKLLQYTSGLEVVVEERTKFPKKNIVQTLEQAKDEVNTSLLKEHEVSQLKTRFISMASHEFRTPLSCIQLSASLIERHYDRLDRLKVFTHLQKIKMAVADLTSILEAFYR
jgi:two-component system sensor kinase FixL